jgi:hypothetical protein
MVPFVKSGEKQKHRHFIEALKELANEKMWMSALQLCKQ